MIRSYNYDGFGNLTDQNVIAGSAPSYHVVFNPANNRVTGDCADANGNEGACAGGPNLFDVENRLKGNAQATFAYAYAPGNKRIWKAAYSSGTMTSEEIDFWSVAGQKLAAYQLQGCTQPNCDFTGTSGYPPVLVANQISTNYYFGGKLIKNASGYVGADRLGSIGKYYPYGQERPSATTNGTEKFTGYIRDAETGLDYADQRYESPGTGRFLTPDSGGRPRLNDPGSWNKYAYVQGDPINWVDPTGQDYCWAADFACLFDPFFGQNSIVSQLQDTINGIQYAAGVWGANFVAAQALYSAGLITGYDLGNIFSPLPVDLTIDWGATFDFLEGSGTLTFPPQGGTLSWDKIIAALRLNPMTVLLGLFLMQDGSSWTKAPYRNPADLEANCKPVGSPVIVPSTNVRNKGGYSWEQEYDCGAAGHWTIHRLYDKDGNLIEEHSRPGSPKYGNP